MPFYLITAIDKPDSLHIRQQNRPMHLEWLKSHDGKVKLAGARWVEDQPVGSTLLIEADSLGHAHDWAAQDPYAAAGLFASVHIQEIRPAVGEWVPK